LTDRKFVAESVGLPAHFRRRHPVAGCLPASSAAHVNPAVLRAPRPEATKEKTALFFFASRGLVDGTSLSAPRLWVPSVFLDGDATCHLSGTLQR